MSQHFRWTPECPEIVPFNSNYSFPNTSTYCTKTITRITPKGGNIYYPTNVIRIEVPAQGHVNFANTTIQMDVTLLIPGNPVDTTHGASAVGYQIVVRFQNNIQSIFAKVRVMYGPSPLEDLEEYAVLIRCLTEWTAGNPSLCVDQGTITDGIGNSTIDADVGGFYQVLQTRPKHIQGYSAIYSTTPASFSGPTGCGPVGIEGNIIPGYTIPAGTVNGVAFKTVTRRYTIQLLTGLTTQHRLVPAQFMASQLAFEITLASAQSCIMVTYPTGSVPANFTSYINALAGGSGYCVGNISLIPEVLSFDAAYDDEMMAGLQNGIPIQFASWHTFQTTINSNTTSFVLQETARSVKGIFVVQKRAQVDFTYDSGACFFDTSINGASALKGYQFQIGTKFHPAAPVECAFPSGLVGNGGAEAYSELAKFLNILGVTKRKLIIGLSIIYCL